MSIESTLQSTREAEWTKITERMQSSLTNIECLNKKMTTLQFMTDHASVQNSSRAAELVSYCHVATCICIKARSRNP